MNEVVRSGEENILAVISRVASDPNVDVQKVEKLLDMYERIVARQALSAYNAALAKMQPELPIIGERGGIKDRQGEVQIRYALWEDIVGIITPILSKHGFSLSFRTAGIEGGVLVTGVLAHAAGHIEQTSLPVELDTTGSKNKVQAMGSSVSYGQRYTARALLNLRTGDVDDDGKSAGDTYITEEQVMNLEAFMTEVGANKAMFLKFLKIESLDKLPAAQYERAMKALEEKRRRG